MLTTRQRWLTTSLLLTILALSGCAGLISEVPTLAPLPTLTPSPAVSVTPALSDTQIAAPTATLTLTVPPAGSPTPPLGSTPTAVLPDTNSAASSVATSPPPTITYFVGTPEEALPDEPVLLFWTSEHGTEAAIYRLDADGSPGRTWSVPVDGSLTVIPRPGRTEETYVLALTNGIITVEQSFTLPVLCPTAWFFAPAPEDLCPAGDPVQSAALLQEFERGRMFLFNGEIMVLFEDIPTGAEDDAPAWLRMPNPYVEGQPVDDPSIQAPAGLRQPQRGFGAVWRDVAGVSERLGWAVGEEISYTTTIQQTAATETTEGQLFFTNPAGEVLTLIPGGQGWLVAGFVDG